VAAFSSAELFATSEELEGRARDFEAAADRVQRTVRELRDAATDVARGWQSPGADRFHTDFMNFTEQVEPLARAYGAASESLHTLAAQAHEIANAVRMNEISISNATMDILGLERFMADVTGDVAQTLEARCRGYDGELRRLEHRYDEFGVHWTFACRRFVDTLRSLNIPLNIASSFSVVAPALQPARSYMYAAVLTGRPAAEITWVGATATKISEAETPADIAAIFANMSPARRRTLVRDYPGLIANLDGVPLQMRIAANRTRMEADYEAATEGSTEHKRLRDMLGEVEAPDGDWAQ